MPDVRIVSGPLHGVSLQMSDRSLSARWRAALRHKRRRRRTSPVITAIVPAADDPRVAPPAR